MNRAERHSLKVQSVDDHLTITNSAGVFPTSTALTRLLGATLRIATIARDVVPIVTLFAIRKVDVTVATDARLSSDARAISRTHLAGLFTIKTGLRDVVPVVAGLISVNDAITTDNRRTALPSAIGIIRLTFYRRPRSTARTRTSNDPKDTHAPKGAVPTIIVCTTGAIGDGLALGSER